MTIFKYALIRGLKSPTSIVINCALPLLLMFIRPMWEGEFPLGFNFMGVALMYGGFLLARGILNDKLDGTVTRILSAPVSTLGYLFQNLLACMVVAAVQVIAICALGIGMYGWDINFALMVGLVYGTFAAASITFSFAFSCVFKEREVSYAVFSILVSIIALLCGFWIPLVVLPDVLRYIGMIFPAYWTSNAISALISYEFWGGEVQDFWITGRAMTEYWISVGAVILFSLLYLIFGGKRRII